MTATATAALELHARPDTVADALRELGRVKAFGDILKEHEETVRSTLQTAADSHTEETAWSQKLKGVGHAYVTEPDPRPVITDRDAFTAWAAEHTPKRTASRLTVDVGALEHLLNAGDGNPAIAAYLEELGVLRTETLVDATLHEEVFEGATLRGTDGDANEGEVITPEGEVIPGLGWARATPQLTVRIEPAHRKQLVTALRTQLAPPELEATA